MCIDKISIDGILSKLSDDYPIEILDSIDSTNLYLKKKAEFLPEGATVIALSQTAGRGRFTRKFYSPEQSGIYMSILLKPDLPAIEGVCLTAAAAVAVCEAIEKFTDNCPKIKWVNDIITEKGKVCGILSESALNTTNGKIDWAVVGIGINVYEPEGGFNKEICNIAGYLAEKGVEGLKNSLCAYIIERLVAFGRELESKSFLDKYRTHSLVLGKEISVVTENGPVPAKAIDIDENCRLLVQYPNLETEYLNSGEISIKL